MSIRHTIRCDGPTCTTEQPIQTKRPDGWPHFDGFDFCSYFCAAAYAEDREHHPEKYHRHADATLTDSSPTLPLRLPPY